MRHYPIHATRFFFATQNLPCPYLPGRIERRVVTEIMGRDAVQLHDRLSLAGFRRSHCIAYAPACPHCDACKAVRIVASRFLPSRSQRRIINKNSDLIVEEANLSATAEQFDLFSAYQTARHGDGDMAKMGFRDYQALVEETSVETFLFEFREPDGRLAAIMLGDRVDNGLSGVYSFFDPDGNGRSLGSYMILYLVEQAQALGLSYVYLGFWVKGSRKMAYKERFHPLEIRTTEGWEPFVGVPGDSDARE